MCVGIPKCVSEGGGGDREVCPSRGALNVVCKKETAARKPKKKKSLQDDPKPLCA